MQMNIIFCGFDESISLVNRWIRNVNVTQLHTLLNISQFSLIFVTVFRHLKIMIIVGKEDTLCKTQRSATALPKYTGGKLLYTQHTRFGMKL